jgi:hypothetical protein
VANTRNRVLRIGQAPDTTIHAVEQTLISMKPSWTKIDVEEGLFMARLPLGSTPRAVGMYAFPSDEHLDETVVCMICEFLSPNTWEFGLNRKWMNDFQKSLSRKLEESGRTGHQRQVLSAEDVSPPQWSIRHMVEQTFWDKLNANYGHLMASAVGALAVVAIGAGRAALDVADSEYGRYRLRQEIEDAVRRGTR